MARTPWFAIGFKLFFRPLAAGFCQKLIHDCVFCDLPPSFCFFSLFQKKVEYEKKVYFCRRF